MGLQDLLDFCAVRVAFGVSLICNRWQGSFPRPLGIVIFSWLNCGHSKRRDESREANLERICIVVPSSAMRGASACVALICASMSLLTPSSSISLLRPTQLAYPLAFQQIHKGGEGRRRAHPLTQELSSKSPLTGFVQISCTYSSLRSSSSSPRSKQS